MKRKLVIVCKLWSIIFRDRCRYKQRTTVRCFIESIFAAFTSMISKKGRFVVQDNAKTGRALVTKTHWQRCRCGHQQLSRPAAYHRAEPTPPATVQKRPSRSRLHCSTGWTEDPPRTWRGEKCVTEGGRRKSFGVHDLSPLSHGNTITAVT